MIITHLKTLSKITYCSFNAIFITPLRRDHSVNHDHIEHQCSKLSAQSGVCYSHGLVHRRVLRLRLLRPHRVRYRQLLHQTQLGLGRQESHGSSTAQSEWHFTVHVITVWKEHHYTAVFFPTLLKWPESSFHLWSFSTASRQLIIINKHFSFSHFEKAIRYIQYKELAQLKSIL